MISALHEIEAVYRFQSSTNPMVSNFITPPLSPPLPSHPLTLLTLATQARQIPAFRGLSVSEQLEVFLPPGWELINGSVWSKPKKRCVTGMSSSVML